MTKDNACRFVEKMREDEDFRNRVLKTKGSEDLSMFLHKEELEFTKRELVGAMAVCMAQLELQKCC